MKNSTVEEELGSIGAPASMLYWDYLIDFATDHIKNSIVDESRAYKLRLAYEELISNIIRANDTSESSERNNSRLGISLLLRNKDGSLWLVIRTSDTGHQFNPNFNIRARVDTNQPVNERQIGGLGIFLIEQSVDEVSYNWIDGHNVYELCMACDATVTSLQ